MDPKGIHNFISEVFKTLQIVQNCSSFNKTSDVDIQMALKNSSDDDESLMFQEPERKPVDNVLERFPSGVLYEKKILTCKVVDCDLIVIYLHDTPKAAVILLHVPDTCSLNESDISIPLTEKQFMITKQLSGYHRFLISFRNLNVCHATIYHCYTYFYVFI